MSAGKGGSMMPLKYVLSEWSALLVRWGIEEEDLLGAVALGPVTDVDSYDASSAEQRMRLLLKLDRILTRVFADEARIREWLHRPNMHLGQCTPLKVMQESPEWVTWLIKALGVVA